VCVKYKNAIKVDGERNLRNRLRIVRVLRFKGQKSAARFIYPSKQRTNADKRVVTDLLRLKLLLFNSLCTSVHRGVFMTIMAILSSDSDHNIFPIPLRNVLAV
jgi:hypothetical protein